MFDLLNHGNHFLVAHLSFLPLGPAVTSSDGVVAAPYIHPHCGHLKRLTLTFSFSSSRHQVTPPETE